MNQTRFKSSDPVMMTKKKHFFLWISELNTKENYIKQEKNESNKIIMLR
jgi:hypothetical protein